MFAPPTTMTHGDIPADVLMRAGIRMASLVDAGEDIRPTRHQLVTFALAIMAGTVGAVRFDPTGLTPPRQTPANMRFAMSANRTVSRWHGALPPVTIVTQDDGTVVIARSARPPADKGASSPGYRCWHSQCDYCESGHR